MEEVKEKDEKKWGENKQFLICVSKTILYILAFIPQIYSLSSQFLLFPFLYL